MTKIDKFNERLNELKIDNEQDIIDYFKDVNKDLMSLYKKVYLANYEIVESLDTAIRQTYIYHSDDKTIMNEYNATWYIELTDKTILKANFIPALGSYNYSLTMVIYDKHNNPLMRLNPDSMLEARDASDVDDETFYSTRYTQTNYVEAPLKIKSPKQREDLILARKHNEEYIENLLELVDADYTFNDKFVNAVLSYLEKKKEDNPNY